MPYTLFAQQPQLVAATPVAGVALVNGTPNILTWTAPNDGQMHRLVAVCEQQVTSAETGGLVQLTFTTPDGLHVVTKQTFAGGGGLANTLNDQDLLVAPGTTVTLAQASALTAGAAVVWAQFWGA